MAWHANLALDYGLEGGRTCNRFSHTGPLRVLQSLYPEGDAVCHNVLVHPPGGIVGGDTLTMTARLGAGAHALVTTPGATRFYKSTGEPGTQQLHATLGAGARLEWLPQETIAYSGCKAVNTAIFDLAPGAEVIGWDITALGLPHAQQPFARGSLLQHLEITGAWLERGLLDAFDTRLLDSPLGLAGHRCMGTLFFAAGEPIARERREQLLEAIRIRIASDPLHASTGATSPHPRVIAVRSLAPMTEPMVSLLRSLWTVLRQAAWQKEALAPRIWAM